MIVNWVLLAAFAANLVFMIYNVSVFLVPLRVKSMLIGLFYILAAIMTLARSFEVFTMGLPKNVHSEATSGPYISQPAIIADTIATIANVGIGCLFVATMYQINYAIKMIDDPTIDLEKALKRRVVVYALAILFMAFFTISTALIYILVEGTDEQ